MTGNKPHTAIRIPRRSFLRAVEPSGNLLNSHLNMSKSEGIGENESIERISKPTEAEVRAIYEAFEEVVQPSGGAGRRERIHPTLDGEALCSKAGERHNIEGWSNPKPIAAFPLGPDGEPYRPICRYCLREWRDSR